jgi:hypothetical protein
MNDKDQILIGTKKHLADIFVSRVWGRTEDISTKYMDKGNQVEEDSITLYSKISRRMFQKNGDRLANDFISGTPDIYIGESVRNADEVIDIKSSWSAFTFMRAKMDKENKMYYWQLMGYMALTGAKVSTLAYCLVDSPPHLVLDEQRRLAYKMGVIDEQESPDYIAACKEIEKNHHFSDIPEKDRCFSITIERDESEIQRIYDQVERCRTWMNENLMNQP